MSKYLFLVQMDIPKEHEANFNRIYDEQHIPEILKVKGVHSCIRYKLVKSRNDDAPTYCALYELDSPDLPETAEWKAASDTGDWAPMVRPYTSNRRHFVYEKMD